MMIRKRFPRYKLLWWILSPLQLYFSCNACKNDHRSIFVLLYRRSSKCGWCVGFLFSENIDITILWGHVLPSFSVQYQTWCSPESLLAYAEGRMENLQCARWSLYDSNPAQIRFVLLCATPGLRVVEAVRTLVNQQWWFFLQRLCIGFA